MSAAKKFSVQIGQIKIKTDNKTAAKALLAYSLQEAGVISISRPAANGDLVVPAVGSVWPGQGGVYAGLVRGDDGQPGHHLIVATDDAGKLKGEWGNYGSEIKGASSRNDGVANTNAMADAGSKLAKAVLALEIEGHADYYLPAQAELMLCFANAREHFDKEWHWSSTQSSASFAWSQHFSNGTTTSIAKFGEFRARAVRRIPE